MKDSLKAGLKTTQNLLVNEERTIGFLETAGNAGARVYATPALIADVEQTCRDFLLEHLEEGEDSLGTEVNIKHLAPTLLGMPVEVHAEISAVNGRAISFDVTVRDPIDDGVAKGTHQRFIIDVEKTLTRIREKAKVFGEKS